MKIDVLMTGHCQIENNPLHDIVFSIFELTQSTDHGSTLTYVVVLIIYLCVLFSNKLL